VIDTIAERQVLALALSGHPAAGERFRRLPVDVFVDGRHVVVATVLRDRLTRGVPIDTDGVALAAASLAGSDHKAGQVRDMVLQAVSSAPSWDSWDYYADQLVTLAAARRGVQAGQRLVQRLEAASEPGDVPEAFRQAQTDLDAAMAGLAATAVEPPESLEEFLSQPIDPYDWLIPGLWERTDRLMVTGYEGTGKSMLLAQFALTVAAGLHPFTGEVLRPEGHRVLIVDCENPKALVYRRYSTVREKVNYLRETRALPPLDWTQHVRLVRRMEGINLGDPQEFARLEQSVAATAPDMVLAGPIYRMHKTNVNEEQPARELADALDRLRVKYQFMLITEAHVGHVGETGGGRKIRPTGSSLFLRWPEFGFGLKPFGPAQEEEHPSVVQWTSWRGSRDERHWPDLLEHSTLLPWMPKDLHRYMANEPRFD